MSGETKNHEMMNYDFIEGTGFEGLMPKVIEKVGGIGWSDEYTALFPDCVAASGKGATFRGHDALEVVDVRAAFSGTSFPYATGEEIVMSKDESDFAYLAKKGDLQASESEGGNEGGEDTPQEP